MKVRIGTVIAMIMAVLVVMVWAADKSESTIAVDQNNPTELTAQHQETATTEVDLKKASYAVGVQVGAQVVRTIGSLHLDLDAFLNGLGDQIKGNELALTHGELQQVLLAFSQQREQERKAQAVKNGAEAKAFLDANAKREGIVVTKSGLQYEILTPGTGKSPKVTDKVKVHYRGTFVDGTEFDSSYERGEPAVVPLSNVVEGWKEGLQLMKEGAKWKFYIPPDLAYKEQGSATGAVPPNKALIFEVELLEVNPAPTLPGQNGQ